MASSWRCRPKGPSDSPIRAMAPPFQPPQCNGDRPRRQWLALGHVFAACSVLASLRRRHPTPTRVADSSSEYRMGHLKIDTETGFTLSGFGGAATSERRDPGGEPNNQPSQGFIPSLCWFNRASLGASTLRWRPLYVFSWFVGLTGTTRPLLEAVVALSLLTLFWCVAAPPPAGL